MPAVWKPGVKTSRESVCLPQASAHRGVHTKQSIGTCVHFQVCSFIVCQWSRFFLLFCKFCLKDFFHMLFSVFTMCREIYPGHRAELFSAIPGFESDGVVRFENQVAIFKGVNIFLTWRWRSFFVPVERSVLPFGMEAGRMKYRIRNRRRVSNHALYVAQTWGFTDWKI